MEPFTFGVVFVGVTGSALVGIALLDRAGVNINEGMLSLFLETVKYGSILILLKEVSKLFL